MHREVAVKRIQERHLANPESRRRFVREAELTARLQHPGIVPVHGLGQDADGRLCYAMRFVEGETLDSALHRFHEAERNPGRDPGERSLALRELLGRFIAVCNTVAYAHTRGIVHRDLKPGNIMLGDYGQTLVIDWGLARPFARADAAGTTGPPAATSIGEEPGTQGTREGQALGTPAYMSPEQAEGRRGAVGPLSDVFSLGATLYAILTGQPPFQAGTLHEVLDRVRRASFPRPRQVKSTIGPALQAICLKAMACQPAQRYSTAKELAADVEHWLADEPVTAYQEPLAARARRWARRHRALVAGAAALLLATAFSGGAALTWFQRERTALKRSVEADCNDAEQLLEQGRYASASQVLERADGRLAGSGLAPLRPRVTRLRQSVEFVGELEEARLAGATAAGATFDYVGTDRIYAATFARHDLDLRTLTPEEAAERLRAQPIHARLVAALDHWAFIKDRMVGPKGEGLRALARHVDDDSWRQQLRDPRLLNDPVGLTRLAQSAAAREQGSISTVLLSHLLRARQRGAVAESLLCEAQARHPDDFWLNFELGNLFAEKKPAEPAEAIRYYQAALACRRETAAVYNNMGNVLRDQNRLAEAMAAHNRAIALKPDFAPAYSNLAFDLSEQHLPTEAMVAARKAIALRPDLAEPYCNLGTALEELRRFDEAIEAYNTALAVNPEFALAHTGIGNALRGLGKLPEAVAAHRRAIALQPDLASAYSNLGVALSDGGQQHEAEDAFRKAIALKPDYAQAYCNLGVDLHRQHKQPEAVAAYRRAIALKPDYADAYNNLGVALAEQHQLPEAIAAYQKTLALRPDDAGTFFNLGLALLRQGQPQEAADACRKAVGLRPDYAEAYNTLGNALQELHRMREAVEAYHKAIALRPTLAEAYNNLGNALYSQQKLPEAAAAQRRAVTLKPDFAEAYFNLGQTLHALQQLPEAEAAYRRAIAVKPDLAAAYSSLGFVLWAQHKYPEAEDACRKAIARDPKMAEAYSNLGIALADQGKLREAVEAHQKALAIRPDYAEAYCNLGFALQRQGKLAGALTAFRQGHQLGSRRASWPYPTAAWVRNAEQLVQLDAKLPQVLRGEIEPASATERLALAQLCQQDYKQLYAAAARCYREAFEAHPRLFDDLGTQVRYNAACAAALAASGHGKDATTLDSRESAHLRGDALGWLRADLTQWTRLAQSDDPRVRFAVVRTLRHWQADPDLAAFRDRAALAKLTKTERDAWLKLWQEVEAVQAQAGKKRP